ncbi:MAG: hypothetical protein NVSMB66_6850 [Candidatus Doudnabacteria bacterium]
MEVKQTTFLNFHKPIVAQLFLIAVIFGYGGYGLRVGASGNQLAPALPAVQNTDVTTSPVLQSSIEIKKINAVLSFDHCSSSKDTGPKEIYATKSINPVLQNVFSLPLLNAANNVTQQAYNLNPNLDQACADVLTKNLVVQNSLAVESSQRQQFSYIAVKPFVNLVSQSYREGEARGSIPAVLQNNNRDMYIPGIFSFAKTYINPTIVKLNYQSTVFKINHFEILKC